MSSHGRAYCRLPAETEWLQRLALLCNLSRRPASSYHEAMGYIHPYRYLHSYVHNGRIGVLVELGCESDFLIRMDAFQAFAHDVALQIAATAPEDVEMLLRQPFVKDEARTIGEMVEKAAVEFRERIAITRFIRWSTDQSDQPDHTSPPRAPAVILSFRRGA